jgi:hypothetical protein
MRLQHHTFSDNCKAGNVKCPEEEEDEEFPRCKLIQMSGG